MSVGAHSMLVDGWWLLMWGSLRVGCEEGDLT